MIIRTVLLCLALGAAGVLVGRSIPDEAKASGDVRANEAACSASVPRGFSSYPITRFGELRGCLYVDQIDPKRYRVVKRVSL